MAFCVKKQALLYFAMNILLLWLLVFTLFAVLCDGSSKRVQLSCEQIRHFVDGHNLRRQKIAQGMVPGQPSAANMMYMVWDEELAEKAAKWAENGVFSHNPDRTIGSNRWSLIGENIYKATFYSNLNITVVPKIEDALKSWFNEHRSYAYTPFTQAIAGPVGHYTQMVWADSTRVGCGISQRKENGETITLYVCDYGPTGNYIGQMPYRSANVRGYLHCVKGECKKPYGSRC